MATTRRVQATQSGDKEHTNGKVKTVSLNSVEVFGESPHAISNPTCLV